MNAQKYIFITMLWINSSTVSAKPSIQAYAATLPIIWTIHYVNEAISTTIHELGHAGVNHALHGDPIDITIKPNTQSNLQILIPFQGCTRYKTTNTSNARKIFRTLAGPLAGLLATYTQLVSLELIKQRRNKNQCISIKKALKQPFVFLHDAMNMHTIKKAPSIDSLIINGAILLRCVRLITEALYGLAPFELAHTSDGKKLWERILNKKNIKTWGGEKELIRYTAAPIIAIAIIGAIRYTTQKNDTRITQKS